MKLSDFLSERNHACMYAMGIEIHSFTVHGTNVYGITSYISILVAVLIFDRYPDYPMDLFENTSKPPREVLARVYSEGITGYSALKKNKL
ncbi:hypothetical protein L596_026344 [Steinernema carpocapsae]|uniref:Uncharacterized protein n=2 Tax=Steinernema carpocapsae TaxID=34508 RepID=A0A4U5M143_STECR|nr:hypothetical protein L596_026344 [Steinernema carpocapsae]